jgi:hypothetical protein
LALDRLPAEFWLEPFRTRDGWLTIAANALPLLGVAVAGWDASTLVLLYWLETAVIGFWMILQVVVGRDSQFLGITPGTGGLRPSGVGLGLFLLLHAGVFMAVHLFILAGTMPGDWLRHLGSPLDFILGFVVPTGIWVPLAGLFIIRGIFAVDEISRGAPLVHLIVSFYLRIFLMQAAILLGAMGAMMLGSAAVILAILVVLKTLLDLYLPHVVRAAVASMDKAKKPAN